MSRRMDRTNDSRKIETYFDAVPDAIVVVDEAGCITRVNDRVEELFGYEPAELTGEPIERLVPEDVRDQHVAERDGYLDAPTRRPMGADLDISARRKDGTTFPVDVGLAPIDTGDGVEVLAAVRDITEWQALRAKWRTILETAPDAVVVADAASGEIVEVNEQATALFGYAEDELLGSPQTILHPTGEEQRYRRLFEGHMEEASGEPAMFTAMPDGSDIYVETKQGSLVPVEIDAHVFELDDRTRMTGIFRDLSTRKERERQLQDQKRTVETLHDVALEIEACDSHDAVYAEMVEAAEEILEFDIAIATTAEDGTLVPKAVTSDLVEEGYHQRIPVDADDSLAAETYRSGEPSVVGDVRERDVSPADPTYRSALTVPIGDRGVFQAVARSVDAFDQFDRNMTELLATHAGETLVRLTGEEQLQAYTTELKQQNERLEEFTGIVSHDLRNPLNVAEGHLQNVREDCEHDGLEPVFEALDRMNSIIEDTLTLARQGETVGEREVIDLRTFLDRCWSMVDSEGATLEVRIEDDVRINADRDRLRHVFENLFRNALEHAGDDATVRIGRLDDDGLYVEDDGPGIPADEREWVFEPGYSSEPGGTGLGLTIVKRIVESHGWQLTVDESASGGARFRITGDTLFV